MKKSLFATTAIVAAFGLSATAAHAQEDDAGWSVGLSGYSNFMVGFADQDDATTGAGGAGGDASATGGQGYADSAFDFTTDSEVNVDASITLDNGLQVGFQTQLIADSGSNEDNGSADEQYIFIDGSFGEVELGHEDGANNTMHYGATSVKAVAVGTYNNTTGTIVNFTSAAPRLTQFVDSSDNTKINYFSPRFAGVQVGFTFAPDGDQDSFAGRRAAVGVNEQFEGGINYVNSFNGFDIAASLTGAWEDVDAGGGNLGGLPGQASDDYNVVPGLVVGFGGFSFGGSVGFGEVDDQDVIAFDAGIGYSTGPWSVSLTGLYSEADLRGGTTDEFGEVNAGVNYALGQGVNIFSTIAAGENEVGAAGGVDNDYVSLVSGVGVSF
jgi:hypothetical protein